MTSTGSRGDSPPAPRKRAVSVIVAGIVIALAIPLAVMLFGRERLSGVDVDLLHLMRHAAGLERADPAASPVAVIAIDEATYQDPRLAGTPKVMWTPQMAAIQDAVLDAGATVFGWDIILPTSAATYVADRRFDRPLLVSLARHGRNAGRVVMGEVSFAGRLLQPHKGFYTAVGRAGNIRSLNTTPDGDGLIRSMPLFVEQASGDDGTRLVPSMALELAARHLGEDIPPPDGDTYALSGNAIPVQDGRRMLLNFSGQPGAIPSYSFADLLHCIERGETGYFEEHFAGKVVLFGLVSDLEDRKVTSLNLIGQTDMAGAPAPCSPGYSHTTAAPRSTTPGVYLHATAVQNLITATPLRLPPPWLSYLSVIAFAGLATVIALRYRPPLSFPAVIALILVWAAISTIVFRDGLVLPVSEGALAAFLCLVSAVAFRFFTTDKERALIHETFKHYLDPKVIDDMIERGETPQLGGESRELTVFFSDIASFSTISEAMGPDELVAFLNSYFVIIGEEIERHGGVIERFVGDAVLALFGAPRPDSDHAQHCVACCLAIQRRLGESQHLFNVPDGMSVITRIGINSGVMTVGNVGAERRFGYTVIGDAVNLSARLESGNKQFGTTLIVGDRTYELCAEAFEWRVVDVAQVVGRSAPVVLREPLGPKGTVSPERLRQRDRYEEGLTARRQRDFDKAVQVFEELAAEGDEAARVAAERSRKLANDPPGEEWDGVVVLSEK